MKSHAVCEKSESEVPPGPSKFVNLRQMSFNCKGNSGLSKWLLFGDSLPCSTSEDSLVSCLAAGASSVKFSLTNVLLVVEVPLVLGAVDEAKALPASLVLALSVEDPAVDGGGTSTS